MARNRRSGWVDLSRFFWVPLDHDTADAQADAGRMARGGELAARLVREDRAVVEGKSGLYLVTKAPGEEGWRCVCWDSVRGTPVCKHQVAASQAYTRPTGALLQKAEETSASWDWLEDQFLPPATLREREAFLKHAALVLTGQEGPPYTDLDLTALTGRIINLPQLTAEEVLPLLAGPPHSRQLLLAMNLARMSLVLDPRVRAALNRIVHARHDEVNDHATALGVLVLANSPAEERARQWQRLVTHHGPGVTYEPPPVPGERDGSGLPLHVQAAFLAAVPGLAAQLGAPVLRPLLLHEDRSVREAVLRALRTPSTWPLREPLPEEAPQVRRRAAAPARKKGVSLLPPT